MPLTDDFDGTFGSGLSLTVVTPGGSPTTIPIQGIENITPPQRNHKVDKYTNVTGVRAGKEQAVICSEEASEISCTLTYEKAHQMLVDGVCGLNGCTITLVMPDGLTLAGTGGIQKASIARIEDSKHVTADFTLILNAGWTMTDAGSGVVVQTYTVSMTAGAATIDLTACGQGGATDLTGKYIKRIRLEAPATNGAAITIAKGASNGYDISGHTFHVELSAGTEADSTYSSGTAVGGSAKILDVSGTGTDAVKVYIEAMPTA